MIVKLYDKVYKEEWNKLVNTSKNGTFLFYREFMEYHANRFTDHSLLFFEDDELIAILPANIDGNTLISHAGLTYGGIVANSTVRMGKMIKIFDLLFDHLKDNNLSKLIYKAIPYIYHKYPSDEDLYLLFRHGAVLSSRNISSTITLSNDLEYTKLRKRGIKKGLKNNIDINESNRFDLFWPILESNLRNRHQVNPVHTLNEIIYLKGLFPDEIKLFVALDSSKQIIAGSVIFETDTVAHIQYIAATEKAKKEGAVDTLVDRMINYYSSKRYFDYGISTTNGGSILNESLIAQKEGFGARGVVYDIYSVNL